MQLVGVRLLAGLASPRAACPSGAPGARGSPAGRPNSPSPTSAGSTACSAASTSTIRPAIAAVRSGPSASSWRADAVRRPVDALHHVERRADHVRRRRSGRTSSGTGTSVSGQRGHRGVLAAHVVGGGLHVAERRAAHDPPRGAVGDLVGEVGLAAGDHAAAQVAGDLAGPLAVVPAPEGVEVEPGTSSSAARSCCPRARRPCPGAGACRPASGRCLARGRRSSRRPRGAAAPGTGRPSSDGDPRVGDLLGRERAVAGRAGPCSGPASLEHPGLHALRADRLDGHAAVAVGDREPLGEADGGVLGHGVRRAADHGQQPGRRRGDDEPAARRPRASAGTSTRAARTWAITLVSSIRAQRRRGPAGCRAAGARRCRRWP